MSRSPTSNLRRLANGRLISVTGGAPAYTALMFTVWNDTHSATWQSVALLLTFGVVGILSPLTGHLGDRFDRRPGHPRRLSHPPVRAKLSLLCLPAPVRVPQPGRRHVQFQAGEEDPGGRGLIG